MAGIGFELRKILEGGRLSSVLMAFSYSSLISAGPWLISIVSILTTGYMVEKLTGNKTLAIQFQVIVTYLIALSLILTGIFQFLFTRYIADRVFERDYHRVLPNTVGVLLVSISLGFSLSFFIALFFLKDVGTFGSVAFVSTFSALCGIWIVNALLTGLKNYKFILLSYFLSYITIIFSSLFTVKFGLSGLLISFFAGQVLLFSMLFGLVIYNFPSDKFIEFDFLNRRRIYTSLALTGFFYNLGIWADKFVFWFSPETGDRVIGVFRASVLYDTPIFLAYLALVPGMAVFLIRLEADFALSYEKYYRVIREGGRFEQILKSGEKMAEEARNALLDIMRIQAIAVIFIFLLSEEIFGLFKLSFLHIPLFHIDLVGTYLHLFFMSALAILFYFDRRKEGLILTALFVLLNFFLSYITVRLGSPFFGYGFVLSLLAVSILALIYLKFFIRRLHYETFMLNT